MRDGLVVEADAQFLKAELMNENQLNELVQENVSLDIWITFYEGGTRISVLNVATETVSEYRAHRGLNKIKGGLK